MEPTPVETEAEPDINEGYEGDNSMRLTTTTNETSDEQQPERNLFAAIIWRAWLDAVGKSNSQANAKEREDAIDWIFDEEEPENEEDLTFARCCELISRDGDGKCTANAIRSLVKKQSPVMRSKRERLEKQAEEMSLLLESKKSSRARASDFIN